jgi:hypothetical protein
MPAVVAGPPSLRVTNVLRGRRRKVGSVVEVEGKDAAESCCGERGDGRGDGASTAVVSCGVTRLANGERAYGPGGAPGSLKIGFGRGRVGEGVGDANGLGLLAAALGDGDR